MRYTIIVLGSRVTHGDTVTVSDLLLARIHTEAGVWHGRLSPPSLSNAIGDLGKMVPEPKDASTFFTYGDSTLQNPTGTGPARNH